MALASWVAGRFSGSIDPPGGVGATDLGVMEQGFSVTARHAKELIRESDAYGESVVDAIARGLSDVHISFTCMEYKAGPLLAAFPYSTLAPTGASYLGPGVIGRLDTDVAGVLVLTATASTPAASAPATLTASSVIISEGHEIAIMLNSKLRKIPVRLRCYPISDGGTLKYFSTT